MDNNLLKIEELYVNAEDKEILKIGLKNKEFGKIPQNIDQIILGDIDRTRSHKVKAVFILRNE